MFKVRVPRDQKPKFPEECPLCGKEKPDSEYVLVSGNALSDLFSNSHIRGNQISCQVPACKDCASRWTWRRRGHWIIMAAVALAVVFGAKMIWPLLPEDWVPQNTKASKWILFIILILVGLPLAGFIKKWLPVPISLHSSPQYAEFEFKDTEYGMQFDDVNNLIDVDDRFAALEEEDDFDQRMAELDDDDSQ